MDGPHGSSAPECTPWMSSDFNLADFVSSPSSAHEDQGQPSSSSSLNAPFTLDALALKASADSSSLSAHTPSSFDPFRDGPFSQHPSPLRNDPSQPTSSFSSLADADLRAYMESLSQPGPSSSSPPLGQAPPAPTIDMNLLMAALGGSGLMGGAMQMPVDPFAVPRPLDGSTNAAGGGPSSDDTALALKKIQILQQVQQFQSQFIQQQLDQLTRQASGSQFNNNNAMLQAQQSPLAYQVPAQSSMNGHNRSTSLDGPMQLMRHGLPTPAQSSELFPTASTHSHMSPMRLPDGPNSMYRDSNEYDMDGNLIMTPLLSPALTSGYSNTPGSTFQPVNPSTSTTPGSCADFFSPLTSPALGPTEFHQRQQSHHNLTMSPHLLATHGGPSYGADGASVVARRSTSQPGKSRSGRGAGESGKVPKARPSPLIKPVVATGRSKPGKRDSAIFGSPSIAPIMSPSLPLESMGDMEISGDGSLDFGSTSSFTQLQPPFLPSTFEQSSPGSNNSPSPVDLATLQMPPPPVPSSSSRRQSQSSSSSRSPAVGLAVVAEQPQPLAPQTPATFLKIALQQQQQQTQYQQHQQQQQQQPVGPSYPAGHAFGATPLHSSPLASPYLSPQFGASSSSNAAGPPSLDLNAPSGSRSSLSQAIAQPAAPAAKKGKNLKSPALGPVGGVAKKEAAPKGKKAAAPKSAAARAAAADPTFSGSGPVTQPKKTSHKAAEQKRRDSLKAGFDELRCLLPPINVESVDPDTGEPIAGASMPRLPARSPLIPDDNPNRGVSKVALLRCSNKHMVILNKRIERRDALVDGLRDEVARLRGAVGWGPPTGEQDLLLVDVDAVERVEDEDDDEEEEQGDADAGQAQVDDDAEYRAEDDFTLPTSLSLSYDLTAPFGLASSSSASASASASSSSSASNRRSSTKPSRSSSLAHSLSNAALLAIAADPPRRTGRAAALAASTRISQSEALGSEEDRDSPDGYIFERLDGDMDQS